MVIGVSGVAGLLIPALGRGGTDDVQELHGPDGTRRTGRDHARGRTRQPTLCGDWTTRDLAAHLVVRERRLDAAPGITIPFLAGYTDRVQHQVAASTDWDELLDKIASGPPILSPFKLLDPVANMDEMFIHHEDVRRAQSDGQPRKLDDGHRSRDYAGRSVSWRA